MTIDNIDKYGHCCSCHRSLIIEKVSDGKVIHMFLPDKDETEFLLDDGSRMRVCVCKQCKEGKDFNDLTFKNTIMEAVIAGWQLEVDSLVADEKKSDWNKDKGKKHMEYYSKRKILFHNDSVDKHVVESRIKDIQKELEEKVSPKEKK
mgnify:CR=1 FL=1